MKFETGGWVWDFGDGHVSTEQNPSHVYESPGLYSVSLTVSNARGSDQVVKTEYMEVLAHVSYKKFNFRLCDVGAGLIWRSRTLL